MWRVYTTREGRRYPLEVGYKAVLGEQISHDYRRFSSLCREGCTSYGSGGCPPWAPNFEEVKSQYPYGVLVFARFFTRHLPDLFRFSPDPFTRYRLQDIILSSLLNKLGYAILDTLEDKILFFNCGHCNGCGQNACHIARGFQHCCNPRRRTYSIGATGMDIEPTMAELFGIKLQWQSSDNNNEVEYIFKIIGFFGPSTLIQNEVLNQIPDCLNELPCTQSHHFHNEQPSC